MAAKQYVDEIVGGDGKRRYDLVRDDGTKALERVQIVKAYVPEQEGSYFGARDVESLMSHAISAIVRASNWSGDKAPYSQTVAVDQITADTNAIVGLSASATADERRVCRNACLSPTSQAAGSITLIAEGRKPEKDIPIVVIILGGVLDGGA